ncbi:phosphatidate cytidylyltransferase [Gammaproteobacteria bacterium LSUCC0057]|uniref:Phosphatidate cytidylyltransferase n=1 Tax=Gammaproteobacteria bacterium LSUCC0057 TaxID=2559237 RepID=A0A4Y8UMB9_9GAMM|nr:phosphatidate cytidylyltransferase [Gammaproteobacteria bacterium LSUCC0057]
MLLQRVVTALVLAAGLLAGLFLLTPVHFTWALLPLVLVAGDEWCRLAGWSRGAVRALFALALLLLLAALSQWLQLGWFGGDFSGADGARITQLMAATLALWALLLLWIQGYPSSALLWSRWPVMAVVGLLLLAATWLAISFIVHLPAGQWWLLLAILSVACADIGGYFFGRWLGVHKLAPVISPGKTWQGYGGGLVANLLLALLVAYGIGLPLLKMLVLLLVVAAAAPVGDLFESMLKRHRGIKDSGAILPGHGGVLDRIDAQMIGLPLFYLLLIILELAP